MKTTISIFAAISLTAIIVCAIDPIVLQPVAPSGSSAGVWTRAPMTGAQAAYLFGGGRLIDILDLSQCPTNNKHIVTINVSLTDRTFAAISLTNTNPIGNVTALWWPDVP